MNVLSLQGNRTLQVMPGNGFVKCGGFVFDAAVFFRLVRVDQEDAGTAAVLGRRCPLAAAAATRCVETVPKIPRLSASATTGASRKVTLPAPAATPDAGRCATT